MDGDGSVTLTIGKSEMGQGVRTSLAMILADELEADWSRIKLVQASPGPDFKRLGTGGSFSLGGSWKTLRQAGAAAREMLITAAAARLQVDRATCSASKGEVVHAASKRRLKYSELVADAAHQHETRAPNHFDPLERHEMRWIRHAPTLVWLEGPEGAGCAAQRYVRGSRARA